MTFSETWNSLLEELDKTPEEALTTPITQKTLVVSEVKQHRVIVEVDGETRPLQKPQFETLYERVKEADNGFDLDRLPIDAEPYASVFALHPNYTIDRDENRLIETEIESRHPDLENRNVPDIDLYSDLLLLIDGLERYDVEKPERIDTSNLVNLYTLLSDVQRGADDLRKEVSEILLDRVDDESVHGQFGSVQKTSRSLKNLRDEEHVLETLENAGIPEEKVTGVVEDKVDEALEVVDIPEEDVYEIEEREYVRKAEVDEDVKETRLQGLKDQLSAFESDEAEELRDEVEELERRIEELTEFKSGTEYA